MGITYFALGMLSMLALVFVGVIVWGLVKVLRIERQIVAIKENDKFEFDTVHRQFENVYRTTGEIRDDSNQAMNNLWRDITTKFEKMEQYQEIRHDELSRTMNDMYNDSCRYTDRRIDKSLNQKEIL
jgi:hypothetical protein